ncbi:MAG: hypothetical protein M3Y60_14035 [Bacteroidota bacterium]|nr:hypothetical protein [Bacteroidota bacterium]
MKKLVLTVLAVATAVLWGFQESQAQHRPCGVAQGPDGALYVSDNVKGTIYKITYKEK